MQDIFNKQTRHATIERRNRIDYIIKVNDGAEIDKVFDIDRFDPNGQELHIVTKKGVIFILNSVTHKLITAFIPNRKRLKTMYRRCNLPVPKFDRSEICRLN